MRDKRLTVMARHKDYVEERFIENLLPLGTHSYRKGSPMEVFVDCSQAEAEDLVRVLRRGGIYCELQEYDK